MALFGLFESGKDQEPEKPASETRSGAMPTGKLEQGKSREQEGELSVVEVKNTVSWVNSHMKLPFKLNEGKPTNLARFISNISREEAAGTIKVHTHHWRTGIIGRVIFEDDEGRRYRDVDLKGIGYIGGGSDEYRAKSISHAMGASQTGPKGLALERYVLHDRNISEKMLAKGLRTYRIAAIINLEEIVDHDYWGENPEKVDLEEARRRGILEEGDQPVIEVRAFATGMRMDDIDEVSLNDARSMIAQELGKSLEEFDVAGYFKWFARTLGRQVGIIHREGYIHEYLTGGGFGQNITLDCRIVDLDSLKDDQELKRKNSQRSIEKYRQTDIRMARGALRTFRNYILLNASKSESLEDEQTTSQLRQLSISEIDRLFEEAYMETRV